MPHSQSFRSLNTHNLNVPQLVRQITFVGKLECCIGVKEHSQVNRLCTALCVLYFCLICFVVLIWLSVDWMNVLMFPWVSLQVLAHLLDMVFYSDEKERVIPLLVNLMHYVVPYLRNHRYLIFNIQTSKHRMRKWQLIGHRVTEVASMSWIL